MVEDLSGVHVGTHAQLARSLLSDWQLVTRNHLDTNAQFNAARNSLLRVVAGRVEDGNETDELPLGLPIGTVALSQADTQSTVAPVGVFENLGLHVILDLREIVRKLENNLGSTLGSTENAASSIVLDKGNSFFVDGVEGGILCARVLLPQTVAAVICGINTHVNGLIVLSLGREGSVLENVLSCETGSGVEVGLVDRQLVECEGTRLVRAKHVHSGKLLNSSKTAYNGTMLSQLVRAQSQSHRQHRRHGNRNTTHNYHQHILERRAAAGAADTLMVARAKLDTKFDNHPESNGEKTHTTDHRQNLLQVARGFSLTDELGCLAEESV
eukprot:comp23495_c0_seq1/m.39339 comp23495_c0_seq1/g.39339  ORF comp23495_c0_seq1/g.39339 comp23495_c0_seq1/m.39339 type:complete len:327 (+) comp23495_c0_seq1:1839-2819(+)